MYSTEESDTMQKREYAQIKCFSSEQLSRRDIVSIMTYFNLRPQSRDNVLKYAVPGLKLYDILNRNGAMSTDHVDRLIHCLNKLGIVKVMEIWINYRNKYISTEENQLALESLEISTINSPFLSAKTDCSLNETMSIDRTIIPSYDRAKKKNICDIPISDQSINELSLIKSADESGHKFLLNGLMILYNDFIRDLEDMINVKYQEIGHEEEEKSKKYMLDLKEKAKARKKEKKMKKKKRDKTKAVLSDMMDSWMQNEGENNSSGSE